VHREKKKTAMLKKVQGAFWIGHTGCNSYPAKLFQKAAKASEDVGQAKDGFKNGDAAKLSSLI
jgi:hypothetical protein